MIVEPSETERIEIENGTVIDHIPAGKTPEIIKIFELPFYANNNVSILYDASSFKFISKDIIFLPNRFLSAEEIRKIKLTYPQITISTIGDTKIMEKE